MSEGLWKILIESELLKKRIKVIAQGLQSHIDESEIPIALAVVTQGGVPFAMELMTHLRPESYHWGLVGTGSYGAGDTGGKVNLQFNRCGDLTNKRVVIVDDIGDSRATLLYLKDYFSGPERVAEVKTCVMLNKPSRKKFDVPLNFVGFNIPNTFVAGFGLDGGQGMSYTRNYPNIRYKEGTLDQSQQKFWLPDTLPA